MMGRTLSAGWGDLTRELDAWTAGGRRCAFWWRDDDATAASPALERLLAMAGRHALVPAIAAIPATATTSLVDALAGGRAVALQHGWAHADHAPTGARKTELGAHRPLAAVAADLTAGRGRMERLFGTAFLPVLVPPWNRVAADVVAALPRLGFTGLSTWKARAAAAPVPGLRQVNCHVDPIDWRGSRGFAGDEAALAPLVGHLAAKRERRADGDEPTGLLGHHLAFDEAAWAFVDRLLDILRAHPATCWPHPHALFGPAP